MSKDKLLEEFKYEVISETKDGKIKQLYWNIAIGLQEVDNLKPSKYLLKLAAENVKGKKSYNEIEKDISEYYSKQNNYNSDEKEADEVSIRIVKMLNDKTFRFDYNTYRLYHKYLFDGIDIGCDKMYIGRFRDTNISKQEPVLNGDSVLYADFSMIEDTLRYDFDEERRQNYILMNDSQKVARLAEFTSRIWQVHPFREGNTRTTALFIQKYIQSLGLGEMNNEIFKDNSAYFRNALVRANYTNYAKGVREDDQYLMKFFSNLLLNTNYILDNNELYVKNSNINKMINDAKDSMSKDEKCSNSIKEDLER